MVTTGETTSASTNAPHAIDVDTLLVRLEADRGGLAEKQVIERREKYGPNRLHEAPAVPRWRKFLGQFKELVIWILIAAAIIAGVVGEWPDTLAILAIVLLNALIGFFQEEKAERAISALQRLSAPVAKVIRRGALTEISASEIVPGDCIELEAGDSIPADLRLLETYQFQVQEAALTGESVPVEKDADSVLSKAVPLGDRRNMAYMGTVAATGKAKAIATSTGMNTELGHIAGLLQRYKPDPTPLQKRLAELGKVLVAVCLTIVSIIFALEMFRGGEFMEVLLVSISLAVAAVPEGLPAVVTISLALGLQRMVHRKVRVRKLPSVETLGCVTVICSDKTGTLTRNEMTVREVTAAGETFRVTGAGYTPHGDFTRDDRRGGEGDLVNPEHEFDLLRALTVGIRCNSAQLAKAAGNSDQWEVIGDPTEGALVVAAMKARIQPNSPDNLVLFEIPFDSERKVMSVAMADDEGSVLYVKGAPEVVLAKCAFEQIDGNVVRLNDDRRDQIMRSNSEMASRALRVLGVAYRHDVSLVDVTDNESELVFAGLVGMIDPPRDEAKAAVGKCRTAGIRPVMITGDHPATARAIARELHIAGENERVLTGQELDELSDEQLLDEVANVSVYARVSAEHKLRVIRAWKGRGQVVAMTGDGVNDAPAVKAADIGIAMGITGTYVTQEASDMVLMDDNFTSIVNAVEEGRGIFDNIQKVVHYLLSCNAGEVLVMLFAAVVGWPVPLMAIQILWVNLVTDGLPALALGMEPPERDIMRRKPRPPRESVITLNRGLLILLHGLLIASFAIIGFWVTYQGDKSRLDAARTVTFCVIAFAQLFFSIGCRSQPLTMPQLGLFSNPFLFAAIVVSGLLQLGVVTLPVMQPFFGATGVTTTEWPLIILLSIAPVTVIEIAKLLRGGYKKFVSGRFTHTTRSTSTDGVDN